ncbi:MAG TPA: hypothetical protein VMX16_17300 [Terriglobia bacterium]|nr:hypothetical protein [Terriglobia bacterium]
MCIILGDRCWFGWVEPARRRKGCELGLAVNALLASVILAGLLASCGGGSSGGGGITPPGTPAGSYTITVTGTAGSLVHNTNLTLTVQ